MLKPPLIVLLRSRRDPWPSTRQVTAIWRSIYLSWRARGARVRIVILPDSREAQKELAAVVKMIRRHTGVVHVVALEHTVPYGALSFLAAWLEPGKARFHLHLFADVLDRLEELRQMESGLAGFQLSLYAASHLVKDPVDHTLTSHSAQLLPFPVRELFFEAPLARRRRGPPPRLAYVGRLNADKGVLRLLEWWARRPADGAELWLVGAPDAALDVAAGGRARAMRRHERLLRALARPTPGLKVMPFHSPARLTKLLGEVDAVVSTSTFQYEEFGLAVAEAMAMGLPALVTDWGGHKLFLEAPLTRRLSIAASEQELEGHMPWLARPRSTAEQRRWARERFSSSAVERRLRIAFGL